MVDLPGKLVNREIQNVFTPGTVIDDSMIEITLPNYLVSMVCDFDTEQCCFCFVDLGAREIGVFFYKN